MNFGVFSSVVRCFPTKNLVRNYARRTRNPGVSRQINELENQEEIADDPEGFGDAEADFFNVHEMHKTHEGEILKEREKLKHLIVREKYFKEKQPNFLTWTEKEQIRLLHQQDSEEWTVEKLSESFPASPDVIAKLIKGVWLPRTEKRVRDHDKKVMENWTLFRKRKFENIDEELVTHLKKFLTRKASDLDKTKFRGPPQLKLPKPKTTEFLSIVRPKDKVDGQKLLEPEKPHQNPFKKDSSKEISGSLSKRPVRLKDIRPEKGSLEETTQVPHGNPFPASATQLETSKSDPMKLEIVQKHVFNEVELDKSDLMAISSEPIRDKIKIPKNAWKRGATFKVDDCYYDDDGRFLYRVPGMYST